MSTDTDNSEPRSGAEKRRPKLRKRTDEIAEAIKLTMVQHSLEPGDRLQSVRRYARTMGVSPSTVVEAYDRLVAEGTIRAKRAWAIGPMVVSGLVGSPSFSARAQSAALATKSSYRLSCT